MSKTNDAQIMTNVSQIPEVFDLPVVILTASPEEEQRFALPTEPVVDFSNEPLAPEQFIRLLEALRPPT